MLPFLLVLLLVLPAFAQAVPSDPTEATRQAHQAILKELPFADRRDFEDARRGFIATLPDLTIPGPGGKPAWTLKGYEFLLADQAPDTVNPSLWRQAQLNMINGLFQVADRIYQIRGFDLSNMTLIEGDTGLIVIDPLISVEVAKAGLDLYYQHRPRRPVVAVIYTHSHVDHFGGVRGIVDEAEVRSGKVKILAPEGFLEHAVSENVMAGNAMSRRSTYMYGAYLSRGAKGQVDAGLGKTTSLGTVSLIAPTDLINRTGDKRVLDGLEIEFQMAPNTEAPAEMLFYFPKLKALCAAEDMTHNLHNLYTLRGAEVRDGKAWWKAIDEALDLYGGRSEVVFASHHWPLWGADRIHDYMTRQRDLYKYLHDQALHLMNQGLTMNEVGEALRLPPSLAQEWYCRGYYGSLNHDAKAVYQKYLGFYDSNPSHLHPLPPKEAARHYVEYMGGAAAVLERARTSYAQGDYRWVAEVLNHVVFADPTNQAARDLEAQALEQLGYQAESGPWRNEYLMGAWELRQGKPREAALSTASGDVVSALTPEMIFDVTGIALNAARAEGKHLVLAFQLTDTQEHYVLTLENSALTYSSRRQPAQVDATFRLTRRVLLGLLSGKVPLEAARQAGQMQVEGHGEKLAELLGMLDRFTPSFDIVTPRP